MKVDKLKELIRTYFIIVFAFSGSICIITFNIAAYVDSLDNFISKYYREVFMLSLLSPVIYFVLLSKLPKSTDIFNKIYTLGNSVLSYASIWITTYIDAYRNIRSFICNILCNQYCYDYSHIMLMRDKN